MSTVRIGDIDLAYETSGSGPPLVAIMGLTGTRAHWRGFVERFADQHQVITFDNRGVGGTSVPPGPYSCAQMAGDTLALMDHLGVESADVFGVSMGGMIAQELVLKAPARVKKLVLGCTMFGGRTAIPVPQSTMAAFANVAAGPAALQHLLELNFSARYAKEEGAGAATIKYLLDLAYKNRMSPVGFQGQFAAVATHETADRLASANAPTLVITGDEDHLIPSGNAELIAKLLPNARAVILPGVGHMFWLETPDAAEKAIRGFLQH